MVPPRIENTLGVLAIPSASLKQMRGLHCVGNLALRLMCFALCGCGCTCSVLEASWLLCAKAVVRLQRLLHVSLGFRVHVSWVFMHVTVQTTDLNARLVNVHLHACPQGPQGGLGCIAASNDLRHAHAHAWSGLMPLVTYAAHGARTAAPARNSPAWQPCLTVRRAWHLHRLWRRGHGGHGACLGHWHTYCV